MEEKNGDYCVKNRFSLVLGLISIVTSLFWYITLPTGVIAIMLGTKLTKETNGKYGKSGMITGIVGLSLFALVYIGMILLIIEYYI